MEESTMKKLGFFAVLLSCAMFVGCPGDAKKPAAGTEKPAAEQKADDKKADDQKADDQKAGEENKGGEENK